MNRRHLVLYTNFHHRTNLENKFNGWMPKDSELVRWTNLVHRRRILHDHRRRLRKKIKIRFLYFHLSISYHCHHHHLDIHEQNDLAKLNKK
jgi:hypothetical protein